MEAILVLGKAWIIYVQTIILISILLWCIAAVDIALLYIICIVSVDENAVLSCAIYDLIIRDHIADSQFTYNEVQTMIDDLCIAWIVYSMLKTTWYVYQYYVVS